MTILRIKLEFPHVNIPVEESDIDIALELYIEKSIARSVFMDEMLCFLHDLKRKDDFKVARLLTANAAREIPMENIEDSIVRGENPVIEVADTEPHSNIPQVSHSTPKGVTKLTPELTTPSSLIKRRKKPTAIIVDDDETDDDAL